MKKSLHYELINKYNDTDGRLILINVEINNIQSLLWFVFMHQIVEVREILSFKR